MKWSADINENTSKWRINVMEVCRSRTPNSKSHLYYNSDLFAIGGTAAACANFKQQATAATPFLCCIIYRDDNTVLATFLTVTENA